MGQWGLGLTVGDGVLAPPHGLEEEKAGLEGAHPGGSPVAWGRQSGRRGQSRCGERPQRGPPAQPCRSVGGHWGLFGGEGAGLWGQSSVAVIFALRLCADNSIPAVVQLILMKYCHYCRIKLVCSRNSQAETLGGRSLFLFWGGGLHSGHPHCVLWQVRMELLSRASGPGRSFGPALLKLPTRLHCRLTRLGGGSFSWRWVQVSPRDSNVHPSLALGRC